VKHITIRELGKLSGSEGLILQGCGGSANEWIDGINEELTNEGILLDGSKFSDVYSFEYDGLTNLLFSMEDVNLDLGKLAMWRIASHDKYGGIWLSDYLPNRLGIRVNELGDGSTTYVLGGISTSDEPIAEPPLKVYVANAHDRWINCVTILLPATAAELATKLDAIDVTDAGGVSVSDVASPISWLADAV
jgi:hypothetical protein